MQCPCGPQRLCSWAVHAAPATRTPPASARAPGPADTCLMRSGALAATHAAGRGRKLQVDHRQERCHPHTDRVNRGARATARTASARWRAAPRGLSPQA